MSVTYYWKTSEGLTYIFTILGLCGLVQLVLSYMAASILYIASPIVLTLVPLGVVLVQVCASVLLAETISSFRTSRRRQTQASTPGPGLQFLRGFATIFVAAALVLGIWGLVYTLWFFATPITQPPYLIKYILGNTSGAIIALTLVIVVEWLFKRN
ncbi:MAG: hypothetical protein ACFFCO_00870 [Promethearchaeota archaeon]